MVTVQHRDVYGSGFPDELAGRADAVFLDLPQPWKALAAAKMALRGRGRICCFSPCMEQVQETCKVLREMGFVGASARGDQWSRRRAHGSSRTCASQTCA